MYLHWHRRDLRATDNRGLVTAVDAAADGDEDGEGRVRPVFVLDPSVLAHAGPPRVAFLLDALGALRAWYRERGGDLVVARGDPRTVLPELAAARDAEGVTWGRDYSGLARERDAAVADALAAAGVAAEPVQDAVLHEPGEITTTDGSPYAVFSYYGTKWLGRPKPAPVSAPAAGDLVAVDDAEPIPALADLGVDPPEATLPDASPAAARERLDAFCDGPIYRYEQRRDDPAADATSRLSPHLKWGTVGIRRVYAETERALAAVDDADPEAEVKRSSVRAVREQLAWREFYVQVLATNPETVTENYRSYERPIQWREDRGALAAWQAGETGYPIVDAGMRQLTAEAWMHNRVRMIVASFLTKDLLLDWREGYAWFREQLVDHDTANDVGGWQWAASTGTDAQPYFRIFNPTTQGERYDPDAEYITAHVPELRGVDSATIHAWPSLSPARRAEVAPEYPDPIVDHETARERALAAFEAAQGDAE
ncbi:MAG: deoxyribodipyrimidine photo-lyase [Haloarculaceae archaeon]